jgi:L-ascorbate metabolism protein UlaG (beta-lactamase superfamily)
MSDLLDGVTWFGGSSLRIRGEGIELYVDPWGLDEDGEADFILLTHPHYDNFSEEDIARVRTPGTVLLAPATMKKQLDDADHFLRPGDMVSLAGVDVLAVPAYNQGKKFHPRDSAWLGYVFTIGGRTFYHAGDTDFLESMKEIRCDVAFVPCDGRYTMGPRDAARAGEACGARVLVPIRWGDGGSTEEEATRLSRHFSGEVRLLPRHD